MIQSRIRPRKVALFVPLMICSASAVSAEITLHAFEGCAHPSIACEGGGPQSTLIEGADGDLYGTTGEGGASGAGTVFRMSTRGQVTTLYSFRNGSDGAYPYGGVTAGGYGDFYGTTSNGGNASAPGGYGTVFKITSAGVLTTLHVFGGGVEGFHPLTALVRGDFGNFYGTTYPTSAGGTVFRINRRGVFKTLYTFTGSPYGGLIKANDGNFYGTTNTDSGFSGYGSVFRITPAGELTTLYTFTGGADGGNPGAALVQGSDGNFYGTTAPTSSFGTIGFGTIFRVTPSGELTTLYTFSGGSDGAYPYAGLVQASDGNFYGATQYGGAAFVEAGFGTVFKLTPNGSLITLHTFNGNDGANPHNTLLQGNDSRLYGTAPAGGAFGAGIVFRLDGPPAVPKHLTARVNNGQVALTWASAPGAQSYNVYQGASANGEDAVPVQTVVTRRRTTISGLTGGMTYYFKVSATNQTGTSLLSEEASVTVGQ